MFTLNDKNILIITRRYKYGNKKILIIINTLQ